MNITYLSGVLTLFVSMSAGMDQTRVAASRLQ